MNEYFGYNYFYDKGRIFFPFSLENTIYEINNITHGVSIPMVSTWCFII